MGAKVWPGTSVGDNRGLGIRGFRGLIPPIFPSQECVAKAFRAEERSHSPSSGHGRWKPNPHKESSK